MQKRYVVFVSSTVKDLVEERAAISQALLKWNCFPSQMENWPAMNAAQLDAIYKLIDDCDYYLVATAGKYGSIDPGTGLSYTELEYDYAIKQGKPIIRLLHRDPFNKLVGDRIENSPSARSKLQKFRSKMEDLWVCSYWDSAENLKSETMAALNYYIENYPAEGWVKSTTGPISNIENEKGALAKFFLKELQNIDKSFEQGVESLPIAIIKLDLGGKIIFSNRLAQNLLPSLTKSNKPKLASLIEGLGRSVREWVRETAAGRGPYRSEVVRVTGTEAYLQITLGQPFDDDEGGLLAVLNDATELKTLEAQFVQSQKMQAIGQLAGGIALDFNELLMEIQKHCEVLLNRHDEADDDFINLVQITQNSNRAAALIGQLLAFSRKQTMQMQPLDLRDVLDNLAHLFDRLVGERVSVRLQHDPAVIPIQGDCRQLDQVFMNLVVNARDAMPKGGEILIETHYRFLDAPMSRDRVTLPAGHYVVVEVTDQGIGISSDNLVRIFDPFFTTNPPGGGSGLGLSMVYGIVKQSGGYIFADSELGRGTQFSLFFPAIEQDG